MWWEVYQWLWPLFTVCHQAHSLMVTVPSPLLVTNVEGALLGVEHQNLGLCPTTSMHNLLVLAAFGTGSLLWLLGVLVTLPYRRKVRAELAWLRQDPFLALEEPRRPTPLTGARQKPARAAAALDELDADIQQLLKDLEKGGKR